MSLKLTCAFSANPRAQPLHDGTVKPQNIDLEFVNVSPGELFYRNLKYDEFDVSEMSLSEMMLAKERSDGTRWDWSGLPVFLSKAFLWISLYVSTASGIEGPWDLKGKRVGVPDYSMTAALWMRAVFKELYGIEAREISWYNGRTKELSHGGVLGLDKDPPPGVTLDWLTAEQTFDVMLDRGELDAAVITPTSVDSPTFTSLDRYGGMPLVGNPRLRWLFPDGGRGIITEYFQRTGLLPANHTIIVQNRVLREHPWVALELYKAFQQSKEMAYQRARRSQSAYLLFNGKDDQDQAAAFVEDPYPLGIKGNRKMLETLIASSQDQGLIRKPTSIEDVFFRTTLDT